MFIIKLLVAPRLCTQVGVIFLEKARKEQHIITLFFGYCRAMVENNGGHRHHICVLVSWVSNDKWDSSDEERDFNVKVEPERHTANA